MQYEVVVGNIGTVVETNDRTVAMDTYDAMVRLSREGTGRAAGEPVTLLDDGEVAEEMLGTNQGDN